MEISKSIITISEIKYKKSAKNKFNSGAIQSIFRYNWGKGHWSEEEVEEVNNLEQLLLEK